MKPQYRKKFILFKRSKKSGHVWYYRLAGEKTAHTTGESLKRRAYEYVENEILPRIERPGRISLGDFLRPFFVWDSCPHIRRLRTEGKSISPRYAKDQRRRIEMYVLGDPICDITIGDLSAHQLQDQFVGNFIEESLQVDGCIPSISLSIFSFTYAMAWCWLRPRRNP
jgi:hypothetical protein